MNTENIIKKYAQDKSFYKSIGIIWNDHDKRYELNKVNHFGKSSQGQTMQLTVEELIYLQEIINSMKID